MKQYTYTKLKTSWALFCLGFVEINNNNLFITIRRPQRSLSSQSLGKYWQLNQNNQNTEHIAIQTNGTLKVAVINSENASKKNLRHERGQTEPGLVAFTTFGQETERVYSGNLGARTKKRNQTETLCIRVNI